VDYWKDRAFELELELKESNRKYNELQNSSIAHSQKMANNQLLLILGMKPGQLEAALLENKG
jgi:hypothetical protein